MKCIVLIMLGLCACYGLLIMYVGKAEQKPKKEEILP